jgi:hypothetical protein
VVILSPAFFSKEWPQRELAGLAAREIDSAKVILPVWHDVDHQFVAGHSAVLADRLGVSTEVGIESVADAISQALARTDVDQGQAPPEPERQRVSSDEEEGALLFSIPSTDEELLELTDVGYTEVIAVASHAHGTLVQLPREREISLGEFMLYAVFEQMVVLGRHLRTFVRVDRRNRRSLALCDRVGLSEERPDQNADLIQRWGELPGRE